MKKMLLSLIIVIFCFVIFCHCNLFSQIKIAVLPFSNLDGDNALSTWCYQLQDSLTKALQSLDVEQKYIIIVPAEEIIAALQEQGIDANNSNFDSEKWKVVSSLNVDKIISGTFRITANRFLINSYIYYPETLLSDPDFQARDIFRRADKVLEAVPMIVRQLSKAFMPES